MLEGFRARLGARTPPGAPRRGFWLEEEPMPAVLPGQGLTPRPVQASPAGVTRPPLVTERQETPPPPVAATELAAELPRTYDDVQFLVADGPGDTPEYVLAPPVPGYTEQPPQRIEDAMAAFEEAVISGTLRGPTPLTDELCRDRELLLEANGRLVARVRVLEGQLRAAGIEPVERE